MKLEDYLVSGNYMVCYSKISIKNSNKEINIFKNKLSLSSNDTNKYKTNSVDFILICSKREYKYKYLK